jgi:hypothetical protein
MSEWFVGQKIVCINDNWPNGRTDSDLPWPVRDRVYTVREVFSDDGKVGLRLCELVAPPREYKTGTFERGYGTKHFRPLETKSIKLFRSIAQGVTDGKPIVPDEEFDPALPTEALCRFMFKHGGRPLL